MQGKVAKSARKELVVPYKCYRTGVFKELRSAFPIAFLPRGCLQSAQVNLTFESLNLLGPSVFTVMGVFNEVR